MAIDDIILILFDKILSSQYVILWKSSGIDFFVIENWFEKDREKIYFDLFVEWINGDFGWEA